MRSFPGFVQLTDKHRNPFLDLYLMSVADGERHGRMNISHTFELKDLSSTFLC